MPDTEFVALVWQGLTDHVDTSARPDQIGDMLVREVTVRCALGPRIACRLTANAGHRADARGLLHHGTQRGRFDQHDPDLVIRVRPGRPPSITRMLTLQTIRNTKLMGQFARILKTLYGKDVVSDAAVLFWHAKGSRPQGRQHFLKSTEPLVKFLKQQQAEESDEDE